MTLIGLMIGIVLAHRVTALAGVGSLVWFSLASGVLGLSIITRRKTRSCLLVLAVVLLGSGLIGLRTHDTPSDRLDAIVARAPGANPSDRVAIEIIGVLTDPIRMLVVARLPSDPPTWSTTRTSTRMRIEGVYATDASGRGTWVGASGSVRVVLPDSMGGGKASIGAGDRVRAVGLFHGPGGARNFGDPDWGALSKERGRVGTVVVTDESMIEPSSAMDSAGMFDRLERWRIRMLAMSRTRALASIGLVGWDAQDPSAGKGDQDQAKASARAVLGALLLGQRDPSFGRVYESFQRVGVAHVLAISGFHLGLVVFLGMLAVRLIGEHPRLERAAVLMTLIAGAVLIPMNPPIVRAGVIVGALIIAGSGGRRYDRLTVLAWVGVGLLVWKPMDVFSLGYQLSMGITALLVIFSQQQAARDRGTGGRSTRLNGRSRWIGRLGGGVWGSFKINLACWSVAMPAIAFHAGVVSLLAPIVSLVLIPVVAAVMVFGYGQIGVGMLWPGAGERTMGVVQGASGWMIGLIQWVDSKPWAWVRIGSIDPLWALGATVGIALVVTRRVKVPSRQAGVLVGGLLVWLIGSWMLTHESARVRIDMLDVGDGSSVLIQSQGEGLIWDCGSLDRRVGKSAARAARAVGMVNIRDAIVTHDNLDHFNGLVELSKRVGLERVWVSRRMIDDPSSAWRWTARSLEDQGVRIEEIKAGTRIKLGQVEVECLWPDPALTDPVEGSAMSDNNASVVVRIVIGVDAENEQEDRTRTVLLTGDIEREAMEALLVSYPDLHGDVIELAHHGSTKPGALAFVQTLDPELVLQSTGASRLDKPYWDPVRLRSVWYTTADRGGIWVRIKSDGSIEHGWAKP